MCRQAALLLLFLKPCRVTAAERSARGSRAPTLPRLATLSKLDSNNNWALHGVDAKISTHDKGLRPHHSTGATAEDSLLFRHRYQHHDDETGMLLYYQYEAKRHRHVVMLDDLGVKVCEAIPDKDGDESLTSLKLVVQDTSSRTRLTSGAVLVGSGLNCALRTGGTFIPWRKTLRERVVAVGAAPIATAEAVTVTLVTTPAALNDVFEHAQVEYYHGRPHRLSVARDKRLTSLAANGESAPEYRFAASADVVAEARAVSVGSENKAAMVTTSGWEASEPVTPPDFRRELAHACYVYPKWDLELELYSTDCTFYQPGGASFERSSCYWRKPNSNELALKVGNDYKVKWKGPVSDDKVRIGIYEKDGGWSSTFCMRSELLDNTHHTGSMSSSPNSFTFTMADLKNYPCANDGGSFPEFVFRVWTESDCHRGESDFQFTIMYDKDITSQLSLRPSSSPKYTYGSASFECSDCHVGGTADAHVLVRVDQLNPFAESWTWGDITLEGNVDFTARASSSVTKCWHSTVASLACLTSICFDVNFAGIAGVKLGIMADLDLNACAILDAEAVLTYKRRVQVAGKVALHTRGTQILYHDVKDFAQVPVSDDVAEPGTLRVNLKAIVQATVTPKLYLGMFASVCTVGQAEVYLRLMASLTAKATLAYRTEGGTFVLTGLDQTDCSDTFLGCNTACYAPHDTRLGASISARYVESRSSEPRVHCLLFLGLS